MLASEYWVVIVVGVFLIIVLAVGIQHHFGARQTYSPIQQADEGWNRLTRVPSNQEALDESADQILAHYRSSRA